MSKTFIYALIDPRNNQIKYIGKSYNPKQRLINHLCDARYLKGSSPKKETWLKSLLNKGLRPGLIILDEVLISEWQFWECHYISLYKSWGFSLVNGDNGGLGSDRLSNEVKQKISQSLKGNIPWNKGHKNTLIDKTRQSKSNPNKKLIAKLNKETLEVISVYESLAAASFHTNIPYTQISLIKDKLNRECHGYRWKTITTKETKGFIIYTRF